MVDLTESLVEMETTKIFDQYYQKFRSKYTFSTTAVLVNVNAFFRNKY